MKSHDFNIVWVESCAYPQKPVGAKHNHEHFHIMYVVEGIGKTEINGNKYSFEPGNIYITPPFEYHVFNNEGEGMLRTLEIKFNIDDPGMASAIKDLPYSMDVRKYPIRKILATIYRESKSKRPRYHDIITNEFQLFLTYLLRCNEENEELYKHVNTESAPSSGITRALDFINENLSYDISLSELANVASFEKNYFVRKFKEKTGKTPMIYVRDKRISKAKQLLKYSEMNVTQIAYETGFKTIHYFSKTFLECTGKRPLDFRKENV